MTAQDIQGFTVLENNKEAIFGKNLPWNKCFYTEWLSALDYAKKWLGEYSYVISEDWQGQPIDYNGCGDMIEIRFNEGIEL